MDPLKEISDAVGGTATLHQLKNEEGEVVHSFGTMSFPLRKDHWIYQKADDGFGFPPPMPIRLGVNDRLTLLVNDTHADPGWGETRSLSLDRRQMSDLIRMAGRYAVRSATMHGAEMDFDPDALLQNLVVGFLGYWTETGYGGEPYENPKEPWRPTQNPAPSPGTPPASENAAISE